VDDAPVIFAGHRIQITLAQEALIVRFHQLVDGVGITAVFRVVHLDRPGILLPTVDRFDFLITANGFSHLGCRDGQRHHDEQDHKENAEQQKSFFVSRPGL
jgi:hypothetical protein